MSSTFVYPDPKFDKNKLTPPNNDHVPSEQQYIPDPPEMKKKKTAAWNE